MPTRLKDVEKFFERMAVLETKVEGLMTWQKWQMGVLAMILLAAVKMLVSR